MKSESDSVLLKMEKRKSFLYFFYGKIYFPCLIKTAYIFRKYLMMKGVVMSLMMVSSIVCVTFDSGSFAQLLSNSKIEKIAETKTGEFILGLV
jgi:hypothetical protein